MFNCNECGTEQKISKDKKGKSSCSNAQKHYNLMLCDKFAEKNESLKVKFTIDNAFKKSTS